MTRTLLGGICLGVAEMIWIVLACLWFHARGFKKGFELGFEAGRARSDEWWLKTIEQIDQGQREKIREEDRRP